MTAAEADWRFTVYGGAPHGFTHDGDAGQTFGIASDRLHEERGPRRRLTLGAVGLGTTSRPACSTLNS